MISKIFTGHSFYGSVKYVCRELKKAEILKVEGVRDYSINKMIEDFQNQHALRPEKKQACFHAILSFYPGEKPSSELITHIADKYLEGLNIVNTQYAIVKHTDKAHLHIHLIANMVNNEGKSISDKWIGLRGKKLAQQLTKNFILKEGISKMLSLTHYENLKEPEQHLYKIYTAINHSLRSCHSLKELEQKLNGLGIEVKYKYKGQTRERQGVSFKLGEYCFKGSRVDRNFSLGNLEKLLSIKNNQIQSNHLNQNYPKTLTETIQKIKNQKAQAMASPTNENVNLLDMLLRREFISDQPINELIRESNKKKYQQRRGLSH